MFVSCNEYLDVVPDNIATLESSFTMRVAAERYLFTCYFWMPRHADMVSNNPGFLAGDEMWSLFPHYNQANNLYILAGDQNAVSPYVDHWGATRGGRNLFGGIRDCNVFLENIDKVQDMMEQEKDRWRAEVKFLKAYYHFWLIRMYGPIPLMRESLPINAGVEEVKQPREPFDTCIDYVVELIDEAMPDLPLVIEDEATELGRITKAAAASMKAYILTTAASPLFNGNSYYSGFAGRDGVELFNPVKSEAKWERAAIAAKEAIDICHEAGLELYRFLPSGGQNLSLSDTTIVQMSIRNSVCLRWNSETIWADPNSIMDQHRLITAWNPANIHSGVRGWYGPTLQVAEQFYSKNGVPIEEDKEYDYAARFDLRSTTFEDRYNLKPNYTTVGLHFDREHRFYATLGFDGSAWYGQGNYDDKTPWYLEGKFGQHAGLLTVERHSPTGYWPRKLIHYQTVIGPSSVTPVWYPWPVMRLADLYLLYAEALNEWSGPGEEVYHYLNLVRERAGLPTVEDAWTQYSRIPAKHTNKEGLREIIHQERTIELALEGQRYWDLRRWMKAHDTFNLPLRGWNVAGITEEEYYRQTAVYNRAFRMREYLWPIREAILMENRNLVQNPGW